MAERKPYRDFSDFLHEHFSFKVQKIAVNAGFTCPNRDGTKGTGGCTYCNNQTFNPAYCTPTLSVSEQLCRGRDFFRHKYPEMKYIAYFQAYTNTYGDLDALRGLYEEALSSEDVVGLIIGTRPDCVPDALLNYLAELAKGTFVLVEYGAESAHDRTLQLINRGHSWSDTTDAVRRTAERGIYCGLHLILGLPEESEEDMLQTIDEVSLLPVDTLKLHQLQLVKGTRLARQVESGELHIARWSVDDYIALCLKIIHRIRRDIAIERFVSQSPDSLLISPKWGLKNHEFADRLNAALRKENKQGLALQKSRL